MSDQLFGPIRKEHFRLFSGLNSRFYAELVRHLEARVFDLAIEPVSRKDLLREIEAFTDQRAWLEELDRTDFSSASNVAQALPALIYGRLIACHWLVESREGYRRLVDLDADARLLLQALEDIASGRVRSFGAEVLKVLTLLRSALEDPVRNGLNIRSAAGAARQFLVNLRAITTAIRSAEQDMIQAGTAEGVLAGFFSDYISNNLVVDYRELRSGNNPYRFRGEIVTQVTRALANPHLMEALALTFVSERLARDLEQAQHMVEEDLRKVANVFEAVDLHLDRIERMNARVERRIHNTLKFLDRIEGADKVPYVEALGQLKESDLPAQAELPAPETFIEDLVPIDVNSLRRARAVPRAVAPTRVRKAPVDPALIAFEQAKRAYIARRSVTPEKVLDYLEEGMGEAVAMDGADLPLQTLDQFFVFERLRSLSSDLVRLIAPRFEIRIRPGRIENDWISCDAFEVLRVKPRREILSQDPHPPAPRQEVRLP